MAIKRLYFIMWDKLANFILKRRIVILVAIGLLTLFFIFKTKDLFISYGVPKLLPDNDSTAIQFLEFKDKFKENRTVYVLGIDADPLENLNLFNNWRALGERLCAIDGVDTVLSKANNLCLLHKDDSLKTFYFKNLVGDKTISQTYLDSIKVVINNQPFLEGRLFNSKTGANLMFLTLDPEVFLSDLRKEMFPPLKKAIEDFEAQNQIDVKISGLPYIRTIMRDLVASEINLFIGLAMLVTVIFLFLFFRSMPPVLISMLVVALGVVWSLGSIPLLGYEVNVLTGLIPPLVIVIAVPNCIYLINKYHAQYRIDKDKTLALKHTITRIGKATLMTNATTSAGFLTFVFTKSSMLKEFGVVASFNVLCLFLVSICIIPISLSLLRAPKGKHTKHLDSKLIDLIIRTLINIVEKHKKWVFSITILVLIGSFIGISLMKTTGNMVDDLPKNHKVVEDLKWIETHFKGVMPFDIKLDTKKKGLVKKGAIWKKIDRLQTRLDSFPQLSKPLSIAEGVKLIKQGFYGGNPSKYALIDNSEKVFFKPYLNFNEGSTPWLSTIVDSTWQETRISFNVKDVQAEEMDSLINKVKEIAASIFNPDKYNVSITGNSIVFLKGTTYLVGNLLVSLGIAIFIVALLMAILFSSFKMVFIAIFTNMIPLLLTAGMMGFIGIPIKPSTILIFSIAFGISVDDTIHFLAKYRQELKATSWKVHYSVLRSLKETGQSMFYTSIILFFGFSVFSISDFGGTQALGLLVSFTLLVAMLANLMVLPSILYSVEKRATKDALEKPFWEIIEDEEVKLEKQALLKEKKKTVTS